MDIIYIALVCENTQFVQNYLDTGGIFKISINFGSRPTITGKSVKLAKTRELGT